MLCLECPWRYDYAATSLIAPGNPAVPGDDEVPRGEKWCALIQADVPPSGICSADVPTLKETVRRQTSLLDLYAKEVGAPPTREATTYSMLQASKKLVETLRILYTKQREGPKACKTALTPAS